MKKLAAIILLLACVTLWGISLLPFKSSELTIDMSSAPDGKGLPSASTTLEILKYAKEIIGSISGMLGIVLLIKKNSEEKKYHEANQQGH